MSMTPAAGTQPSSGQATTALILGIVSILCCQILGPVAWYLGHSELARIKAGQSSMAGEGTAKAGMILGIIGSVLCLLWILWILFFGGLALLGAMAQHR